MAFNSSQLEAAIKEGRFEDIAPQLDAEELQVPISQSVTHICQRSYVQIKAHLRRSFGQALFPIGNVIYGLFERCNTMPVLLQSPNPLVLAQDWPIALHLLGHIYNGNLCDLNSQLL